LSLAWVISAADPAAAVLISRRTSIPPKEAQELAQLLSKGLVAAGVPLKLDADSARAGLARLGIKDSSLCGGKRSCVTELGRQLSVSHVIAVSISQIGADRSIAVELLEVESGAAVEKDALIVPLSASLAPDALAGFGARVKAQLTPAKPPPDQPRVEPPPSELKLVPVEPPVGPPPQLVQPVAAEKSHLTTWVLGGGAVVAVGVGVALLATGLSARSDAGKTTTAADGTLRSPYSGSEALSKAHSADAQLAFAGIAGAVGIGLGAGAVISW